MIMIFPFALFIIYKWHAGNNTIPSLYADDAEIYASSNSNNSDLISKLNHDLKNICN